MSLAQRLQPGDRKTGSRSADQRSRGKPARAHVSSGCARSGEGRRRSQDLALLAQELPESVRHGHQSGTQTLAEPALAAILIDQTTEQRDVGFFGLVDSEVTRARTRLQRGRRTTPSACPGRELQAIRQITGQALQHLALSIQSTVDRSE